MSSKAKGRWAAATASMRFWFDQSFAQLSSLLVLVASRNVRWLGLRCIRVGRVLRQLVLVLKIYNRLGLVKRSLVSSCTKMVDRMASTYVLRGTKKSELVLVGRRGLRSSINRFDFLSSYRFSAYAKM